MKVETEISRIEDFDFDEFPCTRCGKPIKLYYNGGGSDSKECCGLLYRTESFRTDLVTYALSD